jgi:NADH-quinone oxidoreductase subunit E
VASFYAHFSLKPKGKYVIKLCDGTACHVKGSIKILDAIRERLGLSEQKLTTDDSLFTVETVSCLGACGLAPVMLINEDVHGQVKPEQAVELIEEIMKRENEEEKAG